MNVGDAGLISVVCSSMLSSLPTMVPRVSPTFGHNVKCASLNFSSSNSSIYI